MCNISEKIPCLFLISREHILGSISTCENDSSLKCLGWYHFSKASQP